MKIPDTNKPFTVLTCALRLSYMKLFKPELNDQNGKKEFSVILLIPKGENKLGVDGKAEAKALADVIKAAGNDFFKNKLPEGWRNPLKDGDKETYSEGKKAGELKYPGHYFMTVKCGEEYPPLLIGPDRAPVGEGSVGQLANKWQSGDWGKAKINFAGYNTAGNKGVGAWIQGLQFVAKDESFGGGASADDFDDESATYAKEAASEVEEHDIFADA